jgi:hypothetical protein
VNDLILKLFTEYPVLNTVLAGLLAAHGLALFIVNMTPTPVDNAVLRKVYTVIEWIAGIVTDEVKER